MSNIIDIFQIWAWSSSEPEVTWLVESWDEFSIDNNYDGWVAAVKKAHTENQCTRIVKFQMDHDKVLHLFADSRFPEVAPQPAQPIEAYVLEEVEALATRTDLDPYEKIDRIQHHIKERLGQ